MKQRIGLILALAGVILLIEPKIDYSQWMLHAEDTILHYWPVTLIIAGAVLISPRKKKKRSSH